MSGLGRLCIWGWVALGFLLLAGEVAAQPKALEEQMAAVLRYAGLEPSPADVATITEAWARAQQLGGTTAERQFAFRELYLEYSKLQGQDLSSRPQALDALARFATSTFEAGGRMDLRLPEPRGKPTGNYLHVETRGSGPIALLLISDLGVDGRKLYDSFVQRNQEVYTMHIVTLPYAGKARRLPWPEKLDYAARHWLSQIEGELLALLDQPKLRAAVVVGTAAGGYFATRLALLRPQRVRGAVVVDALVNMPMRSRSSPDAPAKPADRLARLRAVAPAPQLFPYARVPGAEELRSLIADPNSTHPTARNWMAFAVKDQVLSRAWTYEALSTGFFLAGFEYQWELFTTDLSDELRSLSVPLLAMGAIHDDGSPRQSPPSLSQWEEIKLANPHVPLTIVAFADARSYLSVECPEEFDRALADFIAKRPVQGKTGFILPRASPRAAAMQAFGSAEVQVTYGRPAVKDREIWGTLVPYGRVWRAGANEATTFTFSSDVRVEGHDLSAGTYTFFVVPEKQEWIVIFNKVSRQWGAFNYNQDFDALRFAAKPEEAPHAEYLSYHLVPIRPNGVEVTLAWEKRRIAFRVEASSK